MLNGGLSEYYGVAIDPTMGNVLSVGLANNEWVTRELATAAAPAASATTAGGTSLFSTTSVTDNSDLLGTT